jgi:GDP-L-fucose synthase
MPKTDLDLSEEGLNAFFKGKSCLVLGGSGFIGSNLAIKLSRMGANVTITYLSNAPVGFTEGMSAVVCDATRLDDLAKVLDRIDYVFIACAITSGSAIMRKTPFVHLSDNMVMNTRILEACEQAKVKKVLFISSSTVYPNSPNTMTEDIATSEFFPAYEIVATMKRASEKLALLYAVHSRNKMETVIVRPSNSYGPKDDFNPETSKVLPALVRKFNQRILPIEVWGDGTDIKDFIYIDDLVDGLARGMAFGGNGEIFNIGSGIDSTVRGAVEILAKECDVSLKSIIYQTDIPSMIPVRRISIEKSRRMLGYFPKIKLSEGLTLTLEWFQKNH